MAKGFKAQILTEGDIAEGIPSNGSSHSKAQDHVELKAGHEGCGQTKDGEEEQLHQDSGLAANPGGRRGQVRAGCSEGKEARETQPCPPPRSLWEGGHMATPWEPHGRETSVRNTAVNAALHQESRACWVRYERVRLLQVTERPKDDSANEEPSHVH